MAEQGATRNGLRVLVVDDDQFVGETIRQMAGLDGHTARFTCDPRRFLELVDEWDPDVLAIDLVMPGMDGVEVLHALAERDCRSCIVLTSGVGHRVLDAAQRSARERGLSIVGVLPKPFRHADLREVLGDCAGRVCGRDTDDRPDRAMPEVDGDMLAEALDDDRIVPFYQPKIRCRDGRLAGFEALARWQHPEFGTVPPGAFIPVAERTGQIVKLTERICSKALRWFGGLDPMQDPEDRGLDLSLNLSARMLEHADLLGRIEADCKRFGLAPQSLTFELTETSAMSDPTASLDLLTRLRVAGYHLSIDDFGTGYSSMLQLVRLPFSELKIDKSFVLSSQESDESRSVVTSVVELGRSLGLTTTAEGVADEAIHEFVCSLGCDYAQGFHLGYPEPGDRIRELWNV